MSRAESTSTSFSRLNCGAKRLNGAERTVASTRDDLSGLANRICRLERLIGISDAGQSESATTALYEILDVRLTPLEARLLTYLEGPYLARVAKSNPGARNGA